MTEYDDILVGRGLTKAFGEGPARVEALRGVDVRVRRGEFLAVMGPSGCGKSTLLHVLGLMASPDRGEVVLNGQVVSRGREQGSDAAPVGEFVSEARRTEIRRRGIGFVFQRFNLLSVLSGIDNMVLAARLAGRREQERQIGPILESLGMAQAARRKPGQMSIGQQQRLAVARALVTRPELLLADEPTGSLDSVNRAALLEILRQANRRDGQTIVLITHQPEVAEVADRVVQMSDGRIIE